MCQAVLISPKKLWSTSGALDYCCSFLYRSWMRKKERTKERKETDRQTNRGFENRKKEEKEQQSKREGTAGDDHLGGNSSTTTTSGTRTTSPTTTLARIVRSDERDIETLLRTKYVPVLCSDSGKTRVSVPRAGRVVHMCCIYMCACVLGAKSFATQRPRPKRRTGFESRSKYR